MADSLIFAKGKEINLPEDKIAGRILITIDSGKMFLDIDNQTRIRLGAEVGQKYTTTGEIFNDYQNNIALGSFSSAQGFKNQAGAKAFTVLNAEGTIDGIGTYTLDSVEGLEIDDVYSIHLNFADDTSGQRYNYGKITAIDAETNTVTVDKFFMVSGKTFAQIEEPLNEYGVDNELNTFKIVNKPLAGTRNIGSTASVFGYLNAAQSKGAVAFGGSNIAYGSWAAAFGFNNEAGYCAFVSGSNNIASGHYADVSGQDNIGTGERAFIRGAGNKIYGFSSSVFGNSNVAYEDAKFSFAAGQGNKVYSLYSVAINYNNQAKAQSSFAAGESSQARALGTFVQGNYCYADKQWSRALGYYLNAKLPYQTVIGKYNADVAGSLFLVGNGTDSGNARKNAFIVYEDGRAAVGKDPTNAMDVATKQYVDNAVTDGINYGTTPPTSSTPGIIYIQYSDFPYANGDEEEY